MSKIKMCVSALGITDQKPDFTVPATYLVQAVKNELRLLSDVTARMCGLSSKDVEICLEEPESVVLEHTFSFIIFSAVSSEEVSERYLPDASEIKEAMLLASESLHVVNFKIWLPPRSCFPPSLAEYQVQ